MDVAIDSLRGAGWGTSLRLRAGRMLLFCPGDGQGRPALLTWSINSTPVSSPPCGPPPGHLSNFDSAPLYLRHMDRPLRCDWINLIAHGGTFSEDKQHRISECNILLKAFEKSMGTASTAASRFPSMLVRMK